MKAIEFECSSREWWGDHWNGSTPYSLDSCTIPDGHCLPNAPVTVYVLTPDPMEAAQLLRLLAVKLESESRLLQPLQAEAQALRYTPDDGKVLPIVNDLDRAHDALHFLDAGCDRETWQRIGRAAIAAGVTVDALDAWSSTAGNYAGTCDVLAAFRTIKADGETGAGTLFHLALDAGWTDNSRGTQRQAPAQTRQTEPPRQPAPGMSPGEV